MNYSVIARDELLGWLDFRGNTAEANKIARELLNCSQKEYDSLLKDLRAERARQRAEDPRPESKDVEAKRRNGWDMRREEKRRETAQILHIERAAEISAELERTAELWREGYTALEISEMTGVTYGTAHGRLNKLRGLGLIENKGRGWRKPKELYGDIVPQKKKEPERAEKNNNILKEQSEEMSETNAFYNTGKAETYEKNEGKVMNDEESIAGSATISTGNCVPKVEIEAAQREVELYKGYSQKKTDENRYLKRALMAAMELADALSHLPEVR